MNELEPGRGYDLVAEAEREHVLAVEEAEAQLRAAINDAAVMADKIRRPLDRLTSSGAWHVDYVDGAGGDDIAHALAVIDRELRNIARVVKIYSPEPQSTKEQQKP